MTLAFSSFTHSGMNNKNVMQNTQERTLFMSIFSLFTGPGPEKLEQKGDQLSKSNLWGKAKIEYEKALAGLEKQSSADHAGKSRLETKIRQAKEELAKSHLKEAENLMDGEYFAEAKDMIALAKEVSEDPAFKKKLDRIKEDIRRLELKNAVTEYEEPLKDLSMEAHTECQGPEEMSDETYFMALCGTLPEEIQQVYAGYGENFKNGYIALNHGDFETASIHLETALRANSDPDSHVPLELATAYVNLDRQKEARELLEAYIKVHPANLPGFQLLCEIYWEQEAFDKADALLAAAPADLTESVALFLLKGQTLVHSGSIDAARDFYLDFLNTYGWNEAIASDLAATFELLKDKDNARNTYKEIMGRCTSCHAGIDPFIQKKYADLCYEAGQYDTTTLENYLALARALPDNAVQIFNRISKIYEFMGSSEEAARFRSFGERAKREFETD